ncbi:lysophospholipid acyltransferase family protein [Phaeovulum sp.]|uniref:lysophospholipid acyltransferase family protein n=1 Tax=Phaeovulum sp. TaxID=2934796 RepID=UPI0035632479
MRQAWQYVRSVFFVCQMYLALALVATLGLPYALLGGRRATFRVIHFYCRWVIVTARLMVGLRCEVRGTPPTGEVLIAAKHQSFLDILMIVSALPSFKFIMKKELRFVPFVGWYAALIGCVPVERGKRGFAIKAMVEAVRAGREQGAPLIIFSQGTRVAAGAVRPYKIGSGVLYREFGHSCVPVAVNVGVFWPRRSMLRKPGLAVIEFLPTIPPGLEIGEFMQRLEAEVEGHSNRLMAEAGFVVPGS